MSSSLPGQLPTCPTPEGLVLTPIGSLLRLLTRNLLHHPVAETPQYTTNVGDNYPGLHSKEQYGLYADQLEAAQRPVI